MLTKCPNCKKSSQMHAGSNVCKNCGERVFVGSPEHSPTKAQFFKALKKVSRKKQ